MGILKTGLIFTQSLKYGKQVGKISKSGLACYAKKSKGATKGAYPVTTYTTVNVLSGEKVLTKVVNGSIKDGYIDATAFDAKGRKLAHYTSFANKFGQAPLDTPGARITNLAERYNKFDQVVSKQYIRLIPSTNEPKVTVITDSNGVTTTNVYNSADNTLKWESKTVNIKA